MSQVNVNKHWVVPRYFHFLFRLIIQGDKNYICEHDLFCFVQELEGMAPTNKDKRNKFKERLDSNDSIKDDCLDANLVK